MDDTLKMIQQKRNTELNGLKTLEIKSVISNSCSVYMCKMIRRSNSLLHIIVFNVILTMLLDLFREVFSFLMKLSVRRYTVIFPVGRTQSC